MTGKRHSKEEIEAARAQQHRDLNAHHKANAIEQRRQQESLGIARYIWRSAGDERVCAACEKNDGKTFRWKKPPKTGHPGEGLCCPDGGCRCVAEPVFDLGE